MANRVKRRAREEAALTFENTIRQKLKSSKRARRKISFTFLQRKALLEANFKVAESGLTDLLPEQEFLLLFCRRFLNSRKLNSYFPVYQSPKALLEDFLQNQFLLRLCIQENNGLVSFMNQATILRPISTWRPKFKRDTKRLLWCFIAHAYIRYPHQVPYFLQRLYHNYCSYRIRLQSSYWIVGYQLIFHLTKGNGWHKFEGFHAFPVPGKANFYIQQSPKKYRGNYLSALYWACLRCYLPKKIIDLFWSTFIDRAEYYLKNGTAVFHFLASETERPMRDWIKLFYLTNQLMRFLNSHFPEEFDKYYHSVIRFFLKEYQDIGMNEIPIWLEYIKGQKDLGKGLKMKGRSIVAFRKKVEQYLAEEYVAKHKSSWKGMEKSDYFLEQGDRSYRITQLKTDFDLYVEGQLMSHCVYTYAGECASGGAAIWSLQEQVAVNQWAPLVTIEVQENHKIWQALARFNYKPNNEWMSIIKTWAKAEELEIV